MKEDLFFSMCELAKGSYEKSSSGLLYMLQATFTLCQPGRGQQHEWAIGITMGITQGQRRGSFLAVRCCGCARQYCSSGPTCVYREASRKVLSRNSQYQSENMHKALEPESNIGHSITVPRRFPLPF